VVAAGIIGIFAAFSVFWTASFVYLYSIPTKNVDVKLGHIPEFNQSLRNLIYYQVFAFFWICAFISGVLQVTVAGAVSAWYFSRDITGYGKSVGSPAIISFGRALTMSLGSIAFGSLILAVVQFLNFLLRMSKKANAKNKLVSIIVGIAQCCLGCLTALIKWVDRWAYIYIAMYGDNFCSSAKNSFNLISRNVFSALMMDMLGHFVLFVGTIFGTGACTLMTVMIIDGLGRQLSAVTLTVVVVTSFAIFRIVANIIGIGADTVFVCYLEDLERNKEGGLYMDPELHTMLQNKAKKQSLN